MWSSNVRIFRHGYGGAALVLLWGVGFVPGANAERVCYTTFGGTIVCRNTVSYGARVGMSIAAFVFLTLLFSLGCCLLVRSRRREMDEEARVYQIDASQMQGPPIMVHHPPPDDGHTRNDNDPADANGGPAREPPFPVSPGGTAAMPPPHSARSGQFPATEARYSYYEQQYYPRPPQTAPVNYYYTGGSYPFPGYSPRAPMPQTAFPGGGGFLRPMYTGQAVEKDKGDVKGGA